MTNPNYDAVHGSTPTNTDTLHVPATPVAPQAPVKVNASVVAKSTTVWGAAIAVLGYLLQPNVLAVLPDKAAAIMKVVGIILSVTGLRSAISKNGYGQ